MDARASSSRRMGRRARGSRWAARAPARHVGGRGPGLGGARGLRRRARRARSRRGCWSCRRPSRASACSSWPAAPAEWGSPPRNGSLRGGEVVLSDVVAEMTAIAAARAAARGLSNVSTRELDLEHIDAARRLLRRRPLPRGAHVRARPGPRGARDPAGPAAGRTGRARGLGAARAQPLAGSRVRRGQRRRSAHRCRRRASRAPSRSATPSSSPACSPTPGSPTSSVTELPCPLRAASFDDWWARTAALAGPLANCSPRCPRMPDKRCARGRAKRSGRTRRPTGLEFPAVTLLATGRCA